MSFQKYLLLVIFLAFINNGLSRSVVASNYQSKSLKSSYLTSYGSSSDPSEHNLSKQGTENAQPIKNQKNVDKETRREERNLEREAKKTCDISYERSNGKRKKCEPSVYEQALPGINFESTDEKIVDEMIRELQIDIKSQNSVIVR